MPKCLFSVLCVTLCRVASADLIVEFDMDTTTPGVQSDLLSPAGPFTVHVVGTLTGGDTLSSYSVGVVYDSAELTATSAFQPTPPAGFDSVLSSLTITATQVTRFSAGILGSPAVTGSFFLGSIDFTPVNPSGTSGDSDLSGFLVSGLDGAFNGVGNPINILFSPSSVSVPEPVGWRLILLAGAVTSLGCGLRRIGRITTHASAHRCKNIVKAARKSWRVLGFLSCVVGITGTARAELSIAIDADPAVPGTQSTRSVFVGEDFSVDLVFALTGTTSLSSYAVSVKFDNLELGLHPEGSAATELLPAPFSLNLTAGVASESNANGDVLTFEAATFSNGAVADSSFVVGSIDFTALSAAGGVGDVDIVPGPFNTGFDGFFDNASAPVNPILTGASVTLASTVPGDFKLDGIVNATDVDLLAANDGGSDLTYDLDGDGLVTFRLNSPSIESDSDWLIRNILQTEYGDANLDHRVNSSDAAIIGGNFGTISGASWSMGNFNGDGAVNSSDAAILGGHFGFQNTEARVGEQMAIVPEPHAHLLVAVAALTGLRMIRRWNRDFRVSPRGIADLRR